MATKKEFTAQDMKKAFEAGARLSDQPSSWAWQRWTRNNYSGRYVRRARRRARATKTVGPLFKKGDKVTVLINGQSGIVLTTPKRKSTGLLFGDVYAYDVDVHGRLQRLSEKHLEKAGK